MTLLKTLLLSLLLPIPVLAQSDTAAIQKAIDACTQAGGGGVLVEKGDYVACSAAPTTPTIRPACP